MTLVAPLFALVPVRSFSDGKRRLAGVLTPGERADLVRAMLEDVLDALSRCAAIDAVAVVTGDAAVAELAADNGALLLPEAPGGGLNASLEGARARLLARYPQAHLLTMPADLPGATPDILESSLLAADADIVLARAADGGTNGLLVRSVTALPYCFGLDSCRRHRAAGLRAGARVRVVDVPALALDIDHPADLAACLSGTGATRTHRLLHGLRILDREPVAIAS